MIRRVIFSVFLLACLSVFADREADYGRLKELLETTGLQIEANTDTVVSFKGYTVRIKEENGDIEHIGLDLFKPEWKEMMDGALLDYIERDLLMQLATDRPGEDSMIVFKVGSLGDLKGVDSNNTFNITTMDSSVLWVDWTLKNGKHVLINVPVSYDLLRGKSRSEIEEAFISQLKKTNSRKKPDIKIEPAALQPYAETEYVLPGPYYINEHITRNMYLASDLNPDFLWDVNHPLESVSNLFICGAGKNDAEVDLTVMKHEYGDKEEVVTNIGNLMAVAEKEGCVPYWGVESYENGKLTGSLFLYNPGQGYDHVLKIECVPEELIAGDGNIIAKAYLYIPSNNVSNLNQPYRVKTEDEKIKYWEN